MKRGSFDPLTVWPREVNGRIAPNGLQLEGLFVLAPVGTLWGQDFHRVPGVHRKILRLIFWSTGLNH